MRYRIVEEPSFSDAVLKVGGARRVDAAMEVLMEPLSRKPFEFRAADVGINRFRYAVTKPIGEAPALIVIFTIDDDEDVVRLRHIEVAEFPYGQL